MESGLSSFHLIDHTSELGLESSGKTLVAAFENAALGMMSVITSVERIEPRQHQQVYIQSNNREDLLVDFLNELLYVFDSAHFAWRKVEVELLSDKELRAILRGEKFDRTRHEVLRDIKAVTYNQLSVQREPDGMWRTRVIFDV